MIPDPYKDAVLAANSVQSAASQDGSVPYTNCLLLFMEDGQKMLDPVCY